MIEYIDRHSNRNDLHILLNSSTPVYLTYTDQRYMLLAYNWYEALKHIKQDHRAVVLCADNQSFLFLTEKNVRCYFVDEAKILENPKVVHSHYVKYYIYPHQQSKIFCYDMLYRKYNTPFIVSDVDYIFLKDVVHLLITTNVNQLAYVHKDTIADKKINGLTTVVWNKTVTDLYTTRIVEWTQHLNATSEHADVNIVIEKLKQSNIALLNSLLFTNNVNWSTNPVKKSAYAIHYFADAYVDSLDNNQLSNVVENKINQMKRNNHWFIKD